MTTASDQRDFSERDANIAINTYTTVLRRQRVPHELFATYWRDVHGPLCARLPGLAWYVQTHLDREQDDHLWPAVEGIPPFPGYVLDGGVEIGFASEQDQQTFMDACHLLFADEQNMFDETIAYSLPNGSTTLVDRVADATPNGDDGLDRMHVHLGAAHGDVATFATYIRDELASALAQESALLKVRVHTPERYDNDNPAPPAPDVNHLVPTERELVAVLELAFESPLERRAFFESEAFKRLENGLKTHVAHATAFAVSGTYVYVRDQQMTLAGLRGSRPAQLIRKLGANNQFMSEVQTLMKDGKLDSD
ncbi:EthD domain-containing protein [Salinicola aestuarinus]|uniref:EthD domain-containing protein n=1 Tax=Salinicola aestuarinus TaxID=1949082 RepID=UPI000DA2101F|nr:EthD domain-containing protein [Salinicola aestuarinus]